MNTNSLANVDSDFFSRLIDHIEDLTFTPNRIDAFRKLIVCLSLQGRLASDETSPSQSTSLSESSNNITSVTEDEIPFTTSGEIVWTRLSQVCRIEKGATPILKADDGPYPLVTTGESRGCHSAFQFDTEAAIIPLVSSTGHGHASLKRLHFQSGKFAVGNILCAVIPKNTDLLSARFVYEYLTAFKDELLVSRMSGTANVSLTINKISEVPVPLIPMSIQLRIFELMTLCDRLSAFHEVRCVARTQLVGATLDRLVSTRSAADLPPHVNRLRTHFDHLFDTPTTIPQLRQTILQLAVQGQLVPQDPNDEPAEEVSMEEIVGRENMKNGLSLKQTTLQSEFSCVPISALRDGVVDCTTVKPISISPESAEPFLIRTDDVFVVRGNGSKSLVGRAGIVTGKPENVIFPDLFIRLLLDKSRVEPAYFLLTWNSPLIRDRIVSAAKTTSGIWKINQGHIASISIPVPPLAEQKRIVAKVTELLSLCDALESQLKTAASASTQLLSAAVHHLLTPTPETRS